MSGGNFRSAESPETNDFSDNSNFEFSEFLMIGDWLDGDPSSVASELSVQNSGFQANEADESGAGSSQPGGSTSSKHINNYPHAHIHIFVLMHF